MYPHSCVCDWHYDSVLQLASWHKQQGKGRFDGYLEDDNSNHESEMSQHFFEKKNPVKFIMLLNHFPGEGMSVPSLSRD